MISDLQSLNFSPNEARVYAAILEIGRTSAGAVIKKTGLHRSVVYETLDKLIGRKLVFKLTKGNITYFQPTDPQRILQNIRNKKDLALELIPDLNKLVDQKLPEITIYEGVEACRRFFLDSVKRLPEGSTSFVAGSVGKLWYQWMGEDAKKYLDIRLKRKITLKMLLFDKSEAEMEILKKYLEIQEYRYIDRNFFNYGNFNVLGDESINLQSVTEPMVLDIKNPTLVKVFKNLFEILWSIGEPI